MRNAARWHMLTTVVATGAVVFQLVLIIKGGVVLDEENPPDLAERLYRFVAYFTIQSNVLVAISAAMVARDPDFDARWWRAMRLCAITGITVTGVVHFLLLRPLLDLEGADYAADKLLHMVVPVLAVIGWVAFGPRPRVGHREIVIALAWPILWLVWMLVGGAISGWYPYPFLDHRKDGTGAVVVACLGITVFFVAVIALAHWLDRRLSATADSAS